MTTKRKQPNAVNAAPKQSGRPFPKGVSGNPAGMKRGTKHRATILTELLREGDIESVIDNLVRKGKGRDTATGRWLVDRFIDLQLAATAREEKRKEDSEREARLMKEAAELRALLPGYDKGNL